MSNVTSYLGELKCEVWPENGNHFPDDNLANQQLGRKTFSTLENMTFKAARHAAWYPISKTALNPRYENVGLISQWMVEDQRSSQPAMDTEQEIFATHFSHALQQYQLKIF